MANTNLSNAKAAKNDEFYTQYPDIQKEINAYLDYDPDVFRGKTVLLPCDDPEWSNFTKFFAQNFELLGLKKLISTSYAYESKKVKGPIQLTLFETDAPQYDASKTQTHGKIFVLTKDENGDGRINIKDLQWQYLEGDGDFRSKEIRQLRDEADIIVTNPPFSLFREFVAWLMEAQKKFIIIGNMNAITYRDIFPLLKDNKMWLGNGFQNGNAYFRIEAPRTDYANGVFDESTNLVKFRNCCWFTNIDHGRRHQPLQLMTMAENFKFSKHKDIRENKVYQRYDNFDAIDVPYTDAIPDDYEGVMGVPISFMDKYCPEQFEIVWRGGDIEWCEKECDFYTPPSKERAEEFKRLDKTWRIQNPYILDKQGHAIVVYQRILIRKKLEYPISYDEPNEVTKAAIEEAMSRKYYNKTYTDVDEMLKDIENEEDV